MQLYRRAVSYFSPDWPLMIVWLSLIALSTGLGLLVAWPMAILVDSVLVAPTNHDLLHRLFLAPLPAGGVGKIIGLAVIGLAMKLAQDLLSMGQSIVSNQINYS